VGNVTNPSERLEAAMVTFDSLHAVAASISPVAVHLEGDMLGHRALLDGTDENLS
jgi:hypothetical protein